MTGLMAASPNPGHRYQYLEAMGIQVWRSRQGLVTAPEEVVLGASMGAGLATPANPRTGLVMDLCTEAGHSELAGQVRVVLTPGTDVGELASPGFPPPATLTPATLTPAMPPSARVPAATPAPATPPLASVPPETLPPTTPPRVNFPAGTFPSLTGAVDALDWEALREAVATCRACGLCATRTQTVFGVGNRHATLMLIGEAPGAEEDRQGEPFVGRAGQLLDRMLAAIGLGRDEVYIANILKCRPPGNRDPKPEEAAACRAFLLRQVALVQPRLLLSLGRVSAQNLLGTDEPVGRLRGHWFSFGPQGLPLMVTYHPSYLLRSPEQKAKSWQDLTQVARRLRGL